MHMNLTHLLAAIMSQASKPNSSCMATEGEANDDDETAEPFGCLTAQRLPWEPLASTAASEAAATDKFSPHHVSTAVGFKPFALVQLPPETAGHVAERIHETATSTSPRASFKHRRWRNRPNGFSAVKPPHVCIPDLVDYSTNDYCDSFEMHVPNFFVHDRIDQETSLCCSKCLSKFSAMPRDSSPTQPLSPMEEGEVESTSHVTSRADRMAAQDITTLPYEAQRSEGEGLHKPSMTVTTAPVPTPSERRVNQVTHEAVTAPAPQRGGAFSSAVNSEPPHPAKPRGATTRLPKDHPPLSEKTLLAHQHGKTSVGRPISIDSASDSDRDESDGETSQIITDHIHQLSRRLQLTGFMPCSSDERSIHSLVPQYGDGERRLTTGAVTHEDLSMFVGPRFSPTGPGGLETGSDFNLEEVTSPLMGRTESNNWNKLPRDTISTANKAANTYLEKLPAASGMIRQNGSVLGDSHSVAGGPPVPGVAAAPGFAITAPPISKADVLTRGTPLSSLYGVSPSILAIGQSLSQRPSPHMGASEPAADLQQIRTSQHGAASAAARGSLSRQSYISNKPAELSDYIQLVLPSSDLAAKARSDIESVQAIRLVTQALTLRENFVMKYHIYESKVVHPVPQAREYWGSTEPVFAPFDCPILPNLNGYIKSIDGIVHVFSDMVPCPASPSSGMANGNRASFGSPPFSERVASAVQPSDDSCNMPLVTGHIPSVGEYLKALTFLMGVTQHPAVKTICHQRLRYLEERFGLHLLFNGAQEISDVRHNHHRDFYNVRKVDTHVHHSACMTQKHLLRFIRHKYRCEGDTVVAKSATGEELTLAQIFQKDLGLTAWEISIDHLNVHALNSCFHRFDRFNAKYSPFGAQLLREVFLKTDNYMEGRFLAELTKEVISDLEDAKYQHVEWRISIYGHSKTEWKKLAVWMQKHNLASKNVRWVIQIPRLYHVYRQRGLVKSMAEILSNIFEPVIEAVLRPQDHPEIFRMLHQVVAWDSVDDESVESKFTTAGGSMPLPADYTTADNPPYAYWSYYIYANIRSLNLLLQARGMNAMPFRPHCGETGSVSHLATAGLLADGINHGIMLRKSPVLQYLYYLWQIGIAMSPLSNNALFHEINKSPVPQFFRIGLNVSLSSDDPLMFHFTDEALLEEYSVCAHLWKLSPVDLCELARNSVLQSSFESQYKRHWLGPKYYKKGHRGNRPDCSNVPQIRVTYREETLREELKYIRDVVMATDAVERSSYIPSSAFDPFNFQRTSVSKNPKSSSVDPGHNESRIVTELSEFSVTEREADITVDA